MNKQHTYIKITEEIKGLSAARFLTEDVDYKKYLTNLITIKLGYAQLLEKKLKKKGENVKNL